ncbi:MAG TPA: hypothetical protein PKA18_12270, partial [Ottowia sp.]|nr:hypothetical protein [Ottowia sp.]
MSQIGIQRLVDKRKQLCILIFPSTSPAAAKPRRPADQLARSIFQRMASANASPHQPTPLMATVGLTAADLASHPPPGSTPPCGRRRGCRRF